MSQHDLDIANQGFPATRADINNALQALGSTSSGATAPSTTYANQLFYDTANNILKIRNEDNDAFISVVHLDQTNDAVAQFNVDNLRLDGNDLSTTNTNGDLTLTPNGTGKVSVSSIAVANTDTDTTNTGSVTLDFSANQNFVLTLTGNVTLANPSDETVGQSGFIVFIQDGTGGRTVSLGTDYETAGGAGLTLSSAASATDIVPYVVAASGRILLGAPQLAFA